MSRRGRPDPVGRWLRRPWWWVLLLGLLTLLMTLPELATARADARLRNRGIAVEGEVLPTWDHGTRVPVRYRHPVTGTVEEATAAASYDATGRVGPVALQVDPDDPDDVRLAGPVDQRPWIEALALFGAMTAAAALWGVTRWWRRARTRALMADDGPAYRLVAVPRPGRVLPRRWRLSLHALDAPAGERPLCTVAVVGQGTDTRARIVDVKGQPRPGGSVAVREVDGEQVWWPAGRVLLAGRQPRPAMDDRGEVPTRRRWAWVVLALAVVLLVVGLEAMSEDQDLLEERSVLVTATVTRSLDAEQGDVRVRYRLDGRDHVATVHLAGPQREGDELRLRADPDHPEDLWQPGTEVPPPAEGSDLGFLLFLVASGVLVLAVLMVRHPAPRAVSLLGPAWTGPLPGAGSPVPSGPWTWAPAPPPGAPPWPSPAPPPPPPPPPQRPPELRPADDEPSPPEQASGDEPPG